MNLKPKPLSTSIEKQILLYLGSLILPPMGFVWGIRYLRENEIKGKITGLICIILTFISLVLVIIWTNNFVRSVQEQVNSQLDIQGF